MTSEPTPTAAASPSAHPAPSSLPTGDITAVRAYMQWPDVDTDPPLPSGFRWNPDCVDIVNSDGTANDPKRRLVRRGGQLDTVICRDADELVTRVTPLMTRLLPAANYRATMTVAVAVPALADNPRLLKETIERARMQLPRLYPVIDPIRPLLPATTCQTTLRAANVVYTAMIRRRHHQLPEKAHRQRMQAVSVHDLCAATSTLAAGTPEAFDITAAGRGGWVALRTFAATPFPAVFNTAVRFTCEFVHAMVFGYHVGGCSGAAVADRFRGTLPVQLPYLHLLEQGWQHTNLGTNPRGLVAKRLAEIRAQHQARPSPPPGPDSRSPQ